MENSENLHDHGDESVISIVVPVYNVEGYLRQCLDSLIGQTYKNLQIILVDDGSTDKSGEICDEYALLDDRIEVIHQKNKGSSIARNAGLDAVVGNYIGFVDSDDYLDIHMYEYLLKAALEKDTDITICGYHSVYNDKKENHTSLNVEKKTISEKVFTPDIFFEKITVFRFLSWNKLYRAEIAQQMRFIPKQIHQDIHYVSRIVLNSKRLTYLDEELYYYRVNRNGSTNTTKYNDNRFCFMEEFNFIINELKTKSYKSALPPFEHYTLTYYINEYRFANSLKGTAEQKRVLVSNYREVFHKTNPDDITGRYGKPVYHDMKLFYRWPSIHYRYHKIRSKVKKFILKYERDRK